MRHIYHQSPHNFQQLCDKQHSLNINAIMKFAIASFVSLVALAQGELYSYNPSDPLGPAHWSTVNVSICTGLVCSVMCICHLALCISLTSITQLTDNQCGGSSQSGIDIPSSGCDDFADYSFSVSWKEAQ
jgi:hypothetical protein